MARPARYRSRRCRTWKFCSNGAPRGTREVANGETTGTAGHDSDGHQTRATAESIPRAPDGLCLRVHVADPGDRRAHRVLRRPDRVRKGLVDVLDHDRLGKL